MLATVLHRWEECLMAWCSLAGQDLFCQPPVLFGFQGFFEAGQHVNARNVQYCFRDRSGHLLRGMGSKGDMYFVVAMTESMCRKDLSVDFDFDYVFIGVRRDGA